MKLLSRIKRGLRRIRNVYFGRNSYFKAVKDINKSGKCDTREEVLFTALSQLADTIDDKTYDKKKKRIVKWNPKKWMGRCKVLYNLARRVRLSKRIIDKVKDVGLNVLKNIENAKERKRIVKEAIIEILKDYGFSESKAKRLAGKLIKSTNKPSNSKSKSKRKRGKKK